MAADGSDANDSTRTSPGRRDLTGSHIGRFLIHERLGAGGMGQVYRADDTQLRRTVAIKRLASRDGRLLLDETALLREAQRASALNHPCIAAVYDVFEEANESFLVMEYVDGTTLRDRLRSPFGLEDFFQVASQCLDALTSAHSKGILHGDLKPANIMLTREGVVKVCDFGLARRVPRTGGTQESMTTVTTPLEGVAGTAAYMAPEVALEQPVDVRSDLFSLGVVFYELLTQRNPFAAGGWVASIDLILHHQPEPVDHLNPRVTPHLRRIVHRMLEKAPDDRFASAEDIQHEIATAHAESHAAERRRVMRRWAKVAGVALVVGVLGVAAVPRLVQQFRSIGQEALPDRIHLAVMPFTERRASEGHAFFSQGFTEVINARLARLTLSRPIQISSAADLRARGVTTPVEAREQLGANLAIDGSLTYAGDNVTIACALVDTRTGRRVREAASTTSAADPRVVQDRAVEMLVTLLDLDITSDERRGLIAHDTFQPGAYDYYLQARGYLLNFDRLENVDNAIAVFRRALEIDQRYALAYAGLGQAYWRKHELTGSSAWVEPARAACEGALGIDPSAAEPHACLGMVLNGVGQYEKAAEEYLAALAREPTNDLLYSGVATTYEKLARPTDAEQAYRRAIEVRPHYWAGYNMLGAFYYRAGRYDDALRMFQQVVNLAPDSFRAYSSLGAVHFMKGQIREAMAAFEQSLAIRANYVAASNLATLLFFEGDYMRSATVFRQALALDQSSYQVWANLASALESAGRREEASSAYKEARTRVLERIRVNPRDASLLIALAEHDAALGDSSKATTSLTAALSLKPTDSHTLFQVAVFYEQRLKQRDAALDWLAKAIAAGQTWREIDRSPILHALREDPRFLKLRHAQ